MNNNNTRWAITILSCFLIIVLGTPKIVCAKNKNLTFYMTVGDRVDIPVSFHNGDYYFHSTNLKVLEFSETGKMIALKKGNARVVLTYFDEDNKPVRKKFDVKIHNKVKRLRWKNKVNKLIEDEEYKFTVKYKAASKKNVVFDWKSSNPEVAKVDSNGKVTALNTGTTVISCKVKGQKKAALKTKLKVVFVQVASIQIDKSSMKLKTGNYYNLENDVSVLPLDATNKELYLTSSDSNVVRVEDSTIYGVGTGTASITIETTDGSEIERTIQVNVDDWLNKNDTKYIAHRGLSKEAPENTLTAFKLAADKGFHATETDVYLTKDDQFVVFHDENLMRMCGVDKNISDLTLEEIKSYTIISGNKHELYKNDVNASYIPTFVEYLQTCKNNGITPMIEIKFDEGDSSLDSDNALYRMYSQIKSVMGDNPCYVISFSENIIKNMNEILLQKKDKSLQLCLLVWFNRTIDSISIYKYCLANHIGFSVGYIGNEDLIDKMIADRCFVGVWTVNECTVAKKYIDMGVDFVVTDRILWNDN